MRGIQELEQSFNELASTAPDGVGIMDAVKAGAHRIRRRRRILAISATSAALAVVMIGVPTVVSGLGQRAPDPAATTYREPLQLTVDVGEGNGLRKLVHGASGGTQFITVRDGDQRDTRIAVHDPGTYDAGHLLRGEAITVQGHPAHYVSDLPVGVVMGVDTSGGEPGQTRLTATPREERAPAVGWQDTSGAWVVVTGWTTLSAPKDALVQVAGLVRLGPPRDIVGPFSLGYIPGGLRPQYAGISTYSPEAPDTMAGFGTGTEPAQTAGMQPPFGGEGLPLTIRMLPRNDYLDEKTGALGAPTRIAGHDAWYVTRSTDEWIVPENGSVLAFDHGQCKVLIQVADRARIPLAELTRMLENAQFTDCAAPGTWVRPLA